MNNFRWFCRLPFGVILAILFFFPATAQQVGPVDAVEAVEAVEQLDRFGSVHDFLAQAVATNDVAGGSLTIIEGGLTTFKTGFGYADLETETPFPHNAPVVLASISKPLLGIALHRFSETGALELDASITNHLPIFADAKLESGQPIARAPTIIGLLTHTSGLRHDNAPQGRIWFQDWTHNQLLEPVIHRVAREFPFKSNPGTKSAYSGIGTDVAARIAEVASGNLRNDFLIEYLSTPLGLTTTFYRDSERIEGLTFPTRYHRDKTTGQLTRDKPRPAPEPNRYNSSGGNIVSTADDLRTVLLMLRDRGAGYLSPLTFGAMMTPHTLGKNARCGFFIRERDEGSWPDWPVVFGHTGSSGTDVVLDFKRDRIIILLTQTSGRDSRRFRLRLYEVLDRLP